MKALVSPSMMCADILRLKEIIDEFEEKRIDYLHIDVMDGVFVPNFCLGTDFCRQIKKATSIPLDIHLMIAQPEKKLDAFPFGEGDIVSVHLESSENIKEALSEIKRAGARAFLAVNPDTPVENVSGYLDLIDGVLLMTVYPGFAGQKMVPGSLERIEKLRRILDENGAQEKRIEVDGNVNFEKAPLMRKAGADMLHHHFPRPRIS